MPVITLELNDTEALALAQFAKRCGWFEYRNNAVDDDEAYLIKDAMGKLQKSLAEEGYSPR